MLKKPRRSGQNRRSRHLWHRIRNQDTPESDITATSALGLEFSGTVEINTPDVDPSRVVDLPAVPIDTEAQACTRVEVNSRANLLHARFATQSEEALSSDAIQVDGPQPWGESHSSPAVSTNQTAPAPAPS